METKAPVRTKTPTITDPEPSRRMWPERLCPKQKEDLEKDIERVI